MSTAVPRSPLSPVQVRSLGETVRLDARTKLLNPKWYEGMLSSGYEGVREIQKRMTNTMGWSATSGMVDNWVYDEVGAGQLWACCGSGRCWRWLAVGARRFVGAGWLMSVWVLAHLSCEYQRPSPLLPLSNSPVLCPSDHPRLTPPSSRTRRWRSG